jgi:hypothetical protein
MQTADKESILPYGICMFLWNIISIMITARSSAGSWSVWALVEDSKSSFFKVMLISTIKETMDTPTGDILVI